VPGEQFSIKGRIHLRRLVASLGNLIDEEIYRSLCKPETDVRAAEFRANLLLMLTRAMPDQFAEIMERGQLNDAFLSAFSNVALAEGEDFNVGEFLRQMETSSKPLTSVGE
jgi:hypothetical protein